ncbi:hypothetical protein K438DRAFT_1760532 [Mycena galopus ATCC 62051]|nr:hypothetical protein K438DRAFT_1760532 [Mycena galopus ATCC 62051]
MPLTLPLALSSSSEHSQYPKSDGDGNTRTLSSAQLYQLSTSSADDTLAPLGVTTSANNETVTPLQSQAATHSRLVTYDTTLRDNRHSGNDVRQTGTPPTLFSNFSHASTNWSRRSDVTFDHGFIGAPTPTLPINGANMLLEMLGLAMSWTADDAVGFVRNLLALGVLPREQLVTLLDPHTPAAPPPFSRAMARDPSNSSTSNATITRLHGAGSAGVPRSIDIRPNELLDGTFDRSSTHVPHGWRPGPSSSSPPFNHATAPIIPLNPSHVAPAHALFSRVMPQGSLSSSTTYSAILDQIYATGSGHRAEFSRPMDVQPNSLFYNLSEPFDRSSMHVLHEPGLRPSSFPPEFVPTATQVASPSIAAATVSPTSPTNTEFRSEHASHLQTVVAHEQQFSLPPAFPSNAPHSAPASSTVFNNSHCGSQHASHPQTVAAVTQPAEHGQQFFPFPPNAPRSAPASSMAFTISHCGTEHASHLQTMTAVMQPAGHRQQQNKRLSTKPPKPGKCSQCGANQSTQWRRHPVSNDSLCNKCGQKARYVPSAARKTCFNPYGQMPLVEFQSFSYRAVMDPGVARYKDKRGFAAEIDDIKNGT